MAEDFGDDRVSALDALQAINEMARRLLNSAANSELIPSSSLTLLVMPQQPATGIRSQDEASQEVDPLPTEAATASVTISNVSPASADSAIALANHPESPPQRSAQAIDQLLSDDSFFEEITSQR